MLTTLIYVIGTLSLHFTDAASPNGFFSLLLPVVNILFFIFLIWQLIFFFSLGIPEGDGNFRFADLLREFWELNYDIAEYGLIRTLGNLVAHLINTVCIVMAVDYYLTLFMDFIG